MSGIFFFPLTVADAGTGRNDLPLATAASVVSPFLEDVKLLGFLVSFSPLREETRAEKAPLQHPVHYFKPDPLPHWKLHEGRTLSVCTLLWSLKSNTVPGTQQVLNK